jgi:hypothetical protein
LHGVTIGIKPGYVNTVEIVLVYRSPRPLTKTYLPPSTETPGTLLTEAAASESPIFLKLAEEIPSTRFGESILMAMTAFSVFLFISALTVTSDRPKVADLRSRFSSSVTLPAVTLTSFFVNVS